MTFQVDLPALAKEGEAYKRFTNSLEEMDRILTKNEIKRSLNFPDLKNGDYDEPDHLIPGKDYVE